MRIQPTRLALTVLALTSSACISARAPRAPTPTSTPDTKPPDGPPGAAAPITIPGEWTIRHNEENVSYRVIRSAVIERADSIGQHDSSTNLTHERVTLVFASTDSADFKISAIADTFTTTSQGKIGPPQPVHLPIQIDGTLSASGLSIVAAVVEDTSCDPGASVIAADMYSLFPHIPAHLHSGLRWQDTTRIRGCQGGIPATSQLIRSFAVLGEALYGEQRALQIQVVDSITAEGQGMQQQHQITLKASGDGQAVYFIDATTGRVIHLEVGHTLHMLITAGGREAPFVQIVQQVFDIAR